MLRIEAYPALGGVIVRVCTTGHCEGPVVEEDHPTAVTRTIPMLTIEQLGFPEAMRDCVVDIITRYPGLFDYALRS